ncbi:unnamed protein product [Thlaspi arvense]|uniref:ACT domain-containing protein ACR n=1 Tax=Thlaspi arvense TaxID=13288 RepID=A0AAU9SVI9_THLAR|nr:unnamed protein product [Thlaspi arvense]
MVTFEEPACICMPILLYLLGSQFDVSLSCFINTCFVYLLKFFCLDRRGLLHDVTQVLAELELSIQTVRVTTTPDERVLDLFFIADNMDLLHTKKRQDETLEQFRSVLVLIFLCVCGEG